jgi:tellurite resistance protein TehA-like permease
MLAYVWSVLSGRRELSFPIGVLGALTGLFGLGLVAYQISPPAWSAFGVSLSVLVGALCLGLVNQSMVLGHWYLVSPKLAGQPLEELTFLLVCALVAQALLLVLNASVPAREVPESAAVLAGTLATNPAFWLRVGVGLLFPLALAYMAWRSSKEHAMMSSTGLLYIAVGAVFVGELLARGLLFVTAAPV